MADSNVAQEVLAYCTKCRMDLNHIIVAMQGDRISKVQCRTCNGFHMYRAPKGVTVAKPKKTRTTAAVEKRTVESEWERLMKERASQPAKTYSPQTAFKQGDKINHATFGDGVVEKLIHPNKMEIVFRSEIKLLIRAQ